LPTVAVWACAAPFAVWAAVRVGGWERGFIGVALIAFTPYVAAASLIALALALVSRRWWAAGVAAIAAVALAWCVLPRWIAGGDAARAAVPGPAAVFMSSNLRAGGADPARVVAIARDRRVDVLAIQELTPEAERALAAAGLADLLPYHVTGPVAGVGGSGLYSRHPITEAGVRENPGGFRQAYATVTVPGARPVVVESMHPAAPADATRAAWLVTDLATAPKATLDGPVRVLIGDFNSTLDHAALRRLLGTGYRDAADAVGAGLTPTWPYYGPRAAVTAKVTIDHVLADTRVGVRDFAVYGVPRTDHRAIVATLVLPGPV
jgi:endonuclease/exonuclease/phosphatase family metal-dependent hydrolase